jgi:UDP-N-acetyl-2-amino-2-deoxyglucuronate dehydrogenase
MVRIENAGYFSRQLNRCALVVLRLDDQLMEKSGVGLVMHNPRNFSSDHRFGVALIGTGQIAETHVQALAQLGERIAIVGATSRRIDRRNAFCARHRIQPFDSIVELIQHPSVDIVVDASPTSARQDVLEHCCLSGRHLLVEKPLERDARVASAMLDRAEAAGITVGVFFQNRFAPAVAMAVAACQRRDLGQLAMARISVPWWRPQSYYDDDHRGSVDRDGGGVLTIQAIHTLDIAIAMIGLPESVRAFLSTTRLHKMETEDFAVAHLTYDNGAVGSLFVTTASFPGEEASVIAQFENASIALIGETLTVGTLVDQKIQVIQKTERDSRARWGLHAAVIEDFLDALVEGRQPRTHGRQSLKAQLLIDALAKSSRDDQRVSITSGDFLSSRENAQ